MDIKHELVAILGFDPEELNTPEMDLMRFGIIENGGDTQADTPEKSQLIDGVAPFSRLTGL